MARPFGLAVVVGQDGVAKGLNGDAGAVRDKQYRAVVHGGLAARRSAPWNGRNLAPSTSPPGFLKNCQPLAVCRAVVMATIVEPLKQQDSCLMKYPVFSLILMAALAAGAVFPVAAEIADRDKPMNIEADALRYDDLKQTSVFTGNVVITKGTTVIRGGRVDVSQDPEGYQQAVVIAAPGTLAFYRKKRDGVDEYIEGEGERIEYDSRPDTVKFIGRAVVRRLNGATLVDETTGALIVYNNLTDVFAVDGGVQNRTAVNPTGRIRAMLSPRIAASAPGSSSAASSAGPMPSLRSSTTLGIPKN